MRIHLGRLSEQAAWLVTVAIIGVQFCGCASATNEGSRQVDVPGDTGGGTGDQGLNIQPRSSDSLSPEELQAVARDIASLQERPFGTPGAEDGLRHLTVWLIESPDVTVAVCGPPYEGFTDTEDQLMSVLQQHFMLAMARFIIEHPDQADDLAAAHQAGYIGLIQVYERATAHDPSNQRPVLERLVGLRDTGGFEDLARRITETCHEEAEAAPDAP